MEGEGCNSLAPLFPTRPHANPSLTGPKAAKYSLLKEGKLWVFFFQLFSGQRSLNSGSLSCSLGVYDFFASVDKPVKGTLIKPQILFVLLASEGQMKAEPAPLIREILALGFPCCGTHTLQGRAAVWEAAITEVSVEGRKSLAQVLRLPGHGSKPYNLLKPDSPSVNWG